MLAPDVLHEVELGVVMATLIHLNRIIHAKRSEFGLQTLNERCVFCTFDNIIGYRSYTFAPASYRLFPPFGRDTIRKFQDNVTRTAKKAGRDWEDMLQVCKLIFINYL